MCLKLVKCRVPRAIIFNILHFSYWNTKLICSLLLFNRKHYDKNLGEPHANLSKP